MTHAVRLRMAMFCFIISCKHRIARLGRSHVRISESPRNRRHNSVCIGSFGGGRPRLAARSNSSCRGKYGDVTVRNRPSSDASLGDTYRDRCSIINQWTWACRLLSTYARCKAPHHRRGQIGVVTQPSFIVRQFDRHGFSLRYGQIPKPRAARPSITVSTCHPRHRKHHGRDDGVRRPFLCRARILSSWCMPSET